MYLDLYQQHPTFLIAATLGAVAGCALGCYAALRNRWHTSSAILLAFLVLLSMVVEWVYGVEPKEYKRAVVAYAVGLSVPTFLPFLMSDIYAAGDREVRTGTLLSLQAVAGLLGVLVYPIWQVVSAFFVGLLMSMIDR